MAKIIQMKDYEHLRKKKTPKTVFEPIFVQQCDPTYHQDILTFNGLPIMNHKASEDLSKNWWDSLKK